MAFALQNNLFLINQLLMQRSYIFKRIINTSNSNFIDGKSNSWFSIYKKKNLTYQQQKQNDSLNIH